MVDGIVEVRTASEVSKQQQQQQQHGSSVVDGIVEVRGGCFCDGEMVRR
jgi:hypothetical protein